MTRIVRLALLLIGLGIVALLVWREGPRVVLRMFVRVGWSVPVVVGLYAAHLGVRAAALWRTVPDRGMPYREVLRIRLSAEAVEQLTFTGPLLAEPALGWLLKRRGATTAVAFAAVVIEYLVYTVVSAALGIVALSLLLAAHMLPMWIRPGAIAVMVLMIAFLGAFAFAAVTGVGLIVPMLRASRVAIGRRKAQRAADEFGRVERLVIAFLHEHPERLAEVTAIEAAAHGLLVLEVWVVITAIGFARSWADAVIVEGGIKFVAFAFAFIPGQLGASEGVYALLAVAIGLPAAAGLTLALVRRLRGLIVAAAGVAALTLYTD